MAIWHHLLYTARTTAHRGLMESPFPDRPAEAMAWRPHCCPNINKTVLTELIWHELRTTSQFTAELITLSSFLHQSPFSSSIKIETALFRTSGIFN